MLTSLPSEILEKQKKYFNVISQTYSIDEYFEAPQFFQDKTNMTTTLVCKRCLNNKLGGRK